MVEACGYTYNPPPEVVPNSLKALEVTELARDQDKHETVHTRLMDAYWSEAANIGDETTLLSLAEQAGLDRERGDRGAGRRPLPSADRLGDARCEPPRHQRDPRLRPRRPAPARGRVSS